MLPGGYPLSGRSGLDEEGALRGLFSALAAVDFEIAIRALEDAVSRVDLQRRKAGNSPAVRGRETSRVLVHAVRITHPAYRG